ncbi:endonuclease [Pseudomonas sp. 22-AL-CL-001]|uniref:endonuclease n=1 Tax=Pseudomonas alabamensis TaxID=3064349 RepID=UPI002712F738|nr:endonuclease [Pseudomonas sp. 22-AL-CL-001]MDO7910009.1 endonuclease [Pseudomonas sp. 22-AL-CL-001]
MSKPEAVRKPNRYAAIIENIFFTHYKPGEHEFQFARSEIIIVAAHLEIALPKNIGDLIYSFRYRYDLPPSILETAPNGLEWIIEGSGQALYKFRLVKLNRIIPNESLITIKIPDSTPEIITAYALSDEQALLAKVRYNRLIDIFLGITAYSLQNHLRTNLKGIGQLEIDEVYVGVDRYGRQFVIPVQAKGGSDKHGVVQTHQDIAFSQKKYPNLLCRAVSAQFMSSDRIAMFEFAIQDGEVKVVEEKHYRLVPSASITSQDLFLYNSSKN